MSTHQTGLTGEAHAEAHLRTLGYVTVTRRYRGEDGEIDLIMRDGDCLVFVEVKYRPRGRMGDGLMAVTPQKRRRMTHAAIAFLTEREQWGAVVRFDVVEITGDGLRHVRDAFPAVGAY